MLRLPRVIKHHMEKQTGACWKRWDGDTAVRATECAQGRRPHCVVVKRGVVDPTGEGSGTGGSTVAEGQVLLCPPLSCLAALPPLTFLGTSTPLTGVISDLHASICGSSQTLCKFFPMLPVNHQRDFSPSDVTLCSQSFSAFALSQDQVRTRGHAATRCCAGLLPVHEPRPQPRLQRSQAQREACAHFPAWSGSLGLEGAFRLSKTDARWSQVLWRFFLSKGWGAGVLCSPTVSAEPLCLP